VVLIYAQYNDQIVGTVRFLKVSESVYEVSKMAVTQGVQGLGIGKLL
jgi:predicted N-acetyltransferase YhbS